MTDIFPIPPAKPESVDALVEAITPTIHARLKSAVELGKWDSGQPLSPEQLEHSMQLIIAYESRYLDEQQHTGAINFKKDKPPCKQ
ncbi:MAG: DUF1315 family protein [Pseudohongiellaceae bacterium]